jgi:hypothetical protein
VSLHPIYNNNRSKIVAYRDESDKPFLTIARSSMRGRYIRKDLYSLDEVLSKVVVSKEKVRENFDGDMIKVSSLRLLVFKEKGCRCVRCGLKGLYFAKEKRKKDVSFHFNLYGIDENGKEVLMTKDHTIPKSEGGTDDLDNLEPMCVDCNCIIKNQEDREKFQRNAG